MKSEQTKELLKKYLDGKASPKETYLMESFLEKEFLSEPWDLPAEEKEAFGLKLKQRIYQQVLDQNGPNSMTDVNSKSAPKPVFRKLWRVSAAAAVIAVFALIGLYTVKRYKDDINERYANDVAPGGNHAILTLADGRKIDLTGSKTGELAKLNGIVVKKAANGLLVFNVIETDIKSNKEQFNSIETPLGGQYRVNLPDGTQVWLNAVSKLTFPTRFNELRRTVELNGEAYFEVAKDKNHPFVVKNNKQEVEVLGTHFNINSYDNEPDIKTTLLEGSVKVRDQAAEKSIIPGEQAILTSAGISVKTVDPALAIDWKNGEFRFRDESLTSILRKLSRWYGVEFKLSNDLDKTPNFSGSVSRFDQISLVLKMLEETGNIKFSINGKVVTVK